MNLGSAKRLIAERRDDVAQFAGYVGVSVAALAVDFAVYAGLLTVARFAFIAALGGYAAGVLLHYLLSSRIVFSKHFHRRGIVAEASTIAKFFAAGASGLLVTVAVVGVLADVVGVHPLIAKLVASGCSFAIVFLNLRLFVFNQPLRRRSPATEIERVKPCLSPTMG